MERKEIVNKATFISVVLVVITINFPKHNVNSIALFLLIVTWLFSAFFSKKIKIFIINKTTVLYSSLFILYAIGLIYTSDLKEGIKAIRLTVPLIALPIIFSTIKHSLKQQIIIKKGFIYTTVILAIVTIVMNYFDIGEISQRFLETGVKKYTHSDLTIKIDNHPTYFSFSILLCFVFIIQLIRNKKLKEIEFVLISLFLLVYLILLSSKIALIVFVVSSVLFIAFSDTVSKHRKLVIIILPIILSGAIFSFNNPIRDRFINEISTISFAKNLKDKTVPISEKNQRVIVYDIYFNQSMTKILFGNGTGDVQNYLNVKYRYYLNIVNRYGFKDLNCHNQYLQSGMRVGILGVFSIILILTISFKYALKFNSMEHLYFIIIVAMFFLFETFFETQRGVMLFGVFNSLFTFAWQEK